MLELKAHASTVWLWFLFKSIYFCFECKLHVCVLIWGPEEGMESPGAGGTDGCLLPDVCAQNQSRGPLEEQGLPYCRAILFSLAYAVYFLEQIAFRSSLGFGIFIID